MKLLNKSNLIFFLIFIIFLSSLLNIYEKRHKVFNKLNLIFFSEEKVEAMFGTNEDDKYWSKKLLNGGYILFFRHAERDKWIDVAMYDALESDVHENGNDESRYAENDYFTAAVCLNERGLIQARAIGEHINKIKLPIGFVVSSVSCRARQTADLAFGGYNSLHRILVHYGPYDESPNRLDKLIDFIFNIEIQEGTNTVISAHNSVIDCKMFSNCSDEELSLEEGGFYVISKRENGLYLEHEFNNYNLFNRYHYLR